VLFTYFLIVPLVMLIIGAFRTSPLDPAAEWTLGGFATVLTSPSTLNSIVTSVIYALATTILTVAIALFFAIVNARLTFRLRSFITPMMLIIATIPTLFYVLGWNMLGTPGSGLLGRGLTLIGLEQLLPLVQTSGWAGLIVVSSLKLSAVAYLLLLAAVRRSDQSLEDAAVTAGTSRIRAFFDITFPLLTPAIAATGALAFVLTLEAFEIPALLGRPAGIYTLSVQVFSYLDTGSSSNYAAASALSLIFVVAVLVLVLVQQRLGSMRDYRTLGGKAAPMSSRNAGAAAPWLTLAVIVFVVIAIVLPVAQIVVGSFQPFFGVFENWTVRHYDDVLSSSRAVGAITNTLIVAAGGGAIAMVASFAIIYAIQRFPQRKISGYLRLGTWVPVSAPGIVLSLALLWTYLYTPGIREMFGSISLMMLALVVAAIPLASRSLEGVMAQIKPELEEAALVSGSPPWRAIWDVTWRLCIPALVSGWLLVSMMISGRVDIPLILQSKDTELVTTQTFAQVRNGAASEAAALYVVYLVILLAIFVAVRLGFYFGIERRARKRLTSQVQRGTKS